MGDKKEIWFPAKRYGFGWGLPVRWQGWIVLAVYVGLLIAGTTILGRIKPSSYSARYGLILTILLVCIVWWKGDPPQWRWKDD
jgi:hypothetical protein